MQAASRQGAIFAILAYTMWGVAPIYFKQLTHVPAIELVSHRVVWSFLFLLALVWWRTGWQPIADILQKPVQLFWLLLSSALIATNWLIFIWAVNDERMLDASLGYYINPLVNVFLGMVFLNERLAKMQWLAMGLAAIGVLVQLIQFGSVPWVALTLAVTFALYGLIRKQVTIDGVSGLLVETTLLLPIALIYLSHISSSHLPMVDLDATTFYWLLAAGLVTTAPLLCFIAAARNLPLSQLGFYQYIGPSFMFGLATCLYGEPFSQDKLVTFGFIWLALLIFSWHGWRTYRKAPKVSGD